MSSRKAFMSTAKPVMANVGGNNVIANPKSFSTGTVGWFANGKVPVECPDAKGSREAFIKAAKAIGAKVDGSNVIVTPKLFSTGTVGWFANGKVAIGMNNCQMSVSLYVPHSKDWKDDATEPTEGGTTLQNCQMSVSLYVIGSKDWPQEVA